jgi:hypothetical protein
MVSESTQRNKIHRKTQSLTAPPQMTVQDFLVHSQDKKMRLLVKQIEDCLLSICQNIDRSHLHGDAALTSVMKIDDTEFRLFMHQLEDQFCLFIPARDYSQLTHLDAIATYIANRLEHDNVL